MEAPRPASGDAPARREHWTVDKRVPVALIVTLALQAGASIWFAAQMSHEVREHTKRLDRLETNIEARREETRAVRETLIELRTTMDGVREVVQRLERAVERLSPNATPFGR